MSRLVLGIGLHQWGAREIVSHGELMQHICNAELEISYEVALWRKACIKVCLLGDICHLPFTAHVALNAWGHLHVISRHVRLPAGSASDCKVSW